jgi:biotin operon repressor
MHSTSTVFSRLLAGLPDEERGRAETIIAGCDALETDPATPHFSGPLAAGVLLVVEEGFVVLRSSNPLDARSVITCASGPGGIVLPPSPDEVLLGLERSVLTILDATARRELLTLPAAAEWILDRLMLALARKQDASRSMAPTRHVERVRRTLLQLAQMYGHVAREGVRIDFPVSHALLAEMIASSRETVTRAVDELQRGGFVIRSGSTYWLRVSPSLAVANEVDVQNK